MTDAEKIADLERRVERLEKGIHRNGEVPTPSIPWGPNPCTAPFVPQPDLGSCSKCGLKMERVMMYVCPQGGNCPTGLGGFSYTVATDSISRNDVAVTVTNTSGTRPNPANGAPKPPGYNPVA